MSDIEPSASHVSRPLIEMHDREYPTLSTDIKSGSETSGRHGSLTINTITHVPIARRMGCGCVGPQVSRYPRTPV